MWKINYNSYDTCYYDYTFKIINVLINLWKFHLGVDNFDKLVMIWVDAWYGGSF